MTDVTGRFVWYELLTNDVAAARAFYGKVVGWGVMDAGMPGMDYGLLTANGLPVGGSMQITPEICPEGTPPCWTGYVAVPDVDATVAAAKAAGGGVRQEPHDIPGVGRFAIITDPQGAVIALLAESAENSLPRLSTTTPGHCGWHELMAADWSPAFDFYAALFGWTKDQAVDIGEMGIYQLFAANGGDAIGGMVTKPPFVPAPAWTYYFTVDDINAAADRVKEAGGQVVMGPMQVPGGSWIAQGIDPQGAHFALTAAH